MSFQQEFKNQTLREQILLSMIDSFRIEGILIPLDVAKDALKKIEVSLDK